MKKKYIKPELLYEQYMLNQHMAAACAIEFQAKGDKEQCIAVGNSTYNMGGITLFMHMNICGTDMKLVENYCYYPSSDSIDTLALHGSTT